MACIEFALVPHSFGFLSVPGAAVLRLLKTSSCLATLKKHLRTNSHGIEVEVRSMQSMQILPARLAVIPSPIRLDALFGPMVLQSRGSFVCSFALLPVVCLMPACVPAVAFHTPLYEP